MPFRITDVIKQSNRNDTVTKSSFFHILDTVDINFSVNAFQNQVGDPTTDENLKYVITNPYSLHTNYGAVVGSDGLYVLNGKTLGTGDIVKSTDYDTRDILGITYELSLDASNQGEWTTSSTGFQGTIIYNDFDDTYYGYNGTTWDYLLKDYVKELQKVSSNIRVIYGDGSTENISLSANTSSINIGISGGPKPTGVETLFFTNEGNVGLTYSVSGITASIRMDVDSVLTGMEGISFNSGGITFPDGSTLNSSLIIAYLNKDNTFSGSNDFSSNPQIIPTINRNDQVTYIQIDEDNIAKFGKVDTAHIVTDGDDDIIYLNAPDVRVEQGISLGSGITFPDGTFQTTAGGGGGGGFVGITATDDSASAQSVVSADDRITINTGTGLSKSVSGSVLTIDAEDAATSSKGIAQFDASDFDVSSGLVTLENTVVKGVSTGNLGQTINSVVLDDHFFSILGGNGITCSLVSGDDSSVLIRAYAADISTDRVWKFDSSAIGNSSNISGGKTALSVSTWPSAGAQIELYFDDEDDNTNSVKDFIEKIEVGDELIYYDTEEPTQDFINATARAYANGSPAWQLNSGVYTVYVTVNTSEGDSTSSNRNKDPFALEVVRRGFSVSPEDQSSTTIKRTNASGQVLQPYKFIAENTSPSSNGEISLLTNSIPYENVQIHKLNGYSTANDNRVYFSGFSNLTDNVLTITAQPGQKGLSGGYAEYKLGPSSYNGTYYSFPILDSITGGDDFGTDDLVYLNLTKGHLDQYVKTFNGETGDVTNTVSDVATFSFLSSSAISTGDKLNAMYRIPYDATLTRIDLKKSATGGFEYSLRIAGPDFGDPLTGEQLAHGETMAAGAGVTGSVTSFSGISGVTAGDYLFLDIVANGAGATALQMWVTYESR